MKVKHLLTAACLAVSASTLGCGIHVGQQVQAGRNALQTGRPEDAAVYLIQAADRDPNYETPSRLPQSVLSYLGRAYYETGRAASAKSALETAVKKNQDDHLARLYLGLIGLHSGDRTDGNREVAAGLKGLHELLEYAAADNLNGNFWDPERRIRTKIERALMSRGDIPLLIASAEEIGRDFDREMDAARRDESRNRDGRGGGGGD